MPRELNYGAKDALRESMTKRKSIWDRERTWIGKIYPGGYVPPPVTITIELYRELNGKGGVK